jgi:hypothetical protein
MLSPAQVIEQLRAFSGGDLTSTLSKIEGSIGGTTIESCIAFLVRVGATNNALLAAAEMKRLSGQINVVIHALGILLCLPHILEDGEKVEYVSLGAGNTGREFDLETSYRVAEFKFIKWQGGPESIRQNGIFKDFFRLADSSSQKRKYLYLLGIDHPMKFFNGGRALNSVLRDNRLRELFYSRHGQSFAKVREYYQHHKDAVIIEDMTPWLPELASTIFDTGSASELSET